MGFIEELSNAFIKSLTRSVQRLAAFIFILFAAGVVMGLHVAGSGLENQVVAVAAPLALAALAFISARFATVIFVLLAIILFIL